MGLVKIILQNRIEWKWCYCLWNIDQLLQVNMIGIFYRLLWQRPEIRIFIFLNRSFVCEILQVISFVCECLQSHCVRHWLGIVFVKKELVEPMFTHILLLRCYSHDVHLIISELLTQVIVIPKRQSRPLLAPVDDVQRCILCQEIPVKLFGGERFKFGLRHFKHLIVVPFTLILFFEPGWWIVLLLKKLEKGVYEKLVLEMSVSVIGLSKEFIK